MKTPITESPLAFLAALLTVSAGLAVASSVPGFGAETSRKGAEALSSSLTSQVPTKAPAVMSVSGGHAQCDSCTSVTLSKPSGNAKGGELLATGGKPVTRVSQHGCNGCSTTLGVSGHGKATTRTITHACSKQTPAAAPCCR